MLWGGSGNSGTSFPESLAPGASLGSGRSFSLFRRGVDGLQRLLDRLWTGDRTYYLGEWHFHPAGAPSPSGIDEREMRAIAIDRNYNCPEPVLVVMGVGGQIQAWVFPENGSPVHLVPRREGPSVSASSEALAPPR